MFPYRVNDACFCPHRTNGWMTTLTMSETPHQAGERPRACRGANEQRARDGRDGCSTSATAWRLAFKAGASVCVGPSARLLWLVNRQKLKQLVRVRRPVQHQLHGPRSSHAAPIRHRGGPFAEISCLKSWFFSPRCCAIRELVLRTGAGEKPIRKSLLRIGAGGDRAPILHTQLLGSLPE